MPHWALQDLLGSPGPRRTAMGQRSVDLSCGAKTRRYPGGAERAQSECRSAATFRLQRPPGGSRGQQAVVVPLLPWRRFRGAARCRRAAAAALRRVSRFVQHFILGQSAGLQRHSIRAGLHGRPIPGPPESGHIAAVASCLCGIRPIQTSRTAARLPEPVRQLESTGRKEAFVKTYSCPAATALLLAALASSCSPTGQKSSSQTPQSVVPPTFVASPPMQLAARRHRRGARSQPGPSIQLSPRIPSTVQFGALTPPAIENAFDVFSWNSFIALIWPPGPTGNGDPKEKPGQSGDNPTVWETWIGLDGIFLPGAKPPIWGAPPLLPPACKAPHRKGQKILAMVGKTPNLLTAPTQPFDTGPLVDQNKAYARFEIHADRKMFDYILNNKLYSKAGQKNFPGTVSFPCGGSGGAGAIIVKAAWEMLWPGD